MKILLLTPTQPLIKNLMRGKLKRGLLPPLGLSYVAGVLEEGGHKVKIIDSAYFGFDNNDIIRETLEFDPGIIGISVITPLAKYAAPLAADLKKVFPSVPLVIGGAHPTYCAEEAMSEICAADIAVMGEGEYTMLEIVDNFNAGLPLDGIKGIYFRNGSRIIKTADRDNVVDLDRLPFPSRHLLPITHYAPEPYENKRLPSTTIIASRGCSYGKCTFCYRSAGAHRGQRYQSPAKTIQEIKDLIHTFGIRELVFYDDTLFSDKAWLNSLCELIAENHLDIIWSCRGRSDSAIDYEILKKAKASGLWGIFFGFESGNQDLLNNIRKGITLEHSLKISGWCHSLGIEIIGSFILGLPGETPEKGAQTIQFAKDLDCDYAAFIPTHPPKGAELYNQCAKDGKIIHEEYIDKMVSTRFMPKVAYVPDGYSGPEEVMEVVKKAYKSFYFRFQFLIKHLKKIRSVSDIKRYCSGIWFILRMLRCKSL